jgi:hypothetical protein
MSQDVKTLKLTPNPAPLSNSTTDEERPQFVCPLTLKEMNGAQPFVYIATCGDVFSQAGLKTVSSSSSSSSASPPPHDNETEKEEKIKQLDICPQCATKYDKAEDILLLNPSKDEEEIMHIKMEQRRLSEPIKTKSKKRKVPTDPDAPPPSKKPSNVPAHKPHTNPSISAASRAVTSSLAAEEAKRKAGMSEAVKSLYSSKDGPQRKETFMTMGTFTRVSYSLVILSVKHNLTEILVFSTLDLAI